MNNQRPIIIKRIKKVEGGHHGGAWKVAYADFVTAMMAFFLLMWLINATSPEQKRGIADYFAPASVSRSSQGSDGLLGGTAFQEDGARLAGSNKQFVDNTDADSDERSIPGGDETRAGKGSLQSLADASVRRAEGAAFLQAEVTLRQALQDMPDVAELSKHILIDQTPEGLNIQLIDQEGEGRSMFAPASADPLPRTRQLLQTVATILEPLPNRITISGHTDTSTPSRGGYTNWELSADRANSARRILGAAGLADDRIYMVSGKAGSEPLYPDDPDLPGNRRISIVVLREAPVLPSDFDL
jgi:chemotaxis protein MotB